MRKYVLCVPPAFDVRLFLSGWSGVAAVCLFVCRPRPSFLPSFQVPQHHSTSIVSLLRPCCAPPIGIESSCEQAMKPALFCLLLLTPDDSPFWPLSFLLFFPVALTTSRQCSFYFIFSICFTGASVSRISPQGGSSNRNGNIQKKY